MDFSKIQPEFRREIIREAEAHLDGQVSVAASADQRAAVMASIFAAIGAALAAGVITVAKESDLEIVLGGIAAAGLFLVGAFLCVQATMPVNFFLPGAAPLDWEEDIAAGRDINDILGEQAGHFQERIDFNLAVIKKNSTWFVWGARAGIAAPFVGGLVWLLVYILK